MESTNENSPIDIALEESERLQLQSKPISLKNISLEYCGINPVDFLAVQAYEDIYPDAFQNAIELETDQYGDCNDSLAYTKLIGAQIAAYNMIHNSNGFPELVQEIIQTIKAHSK